MYMVNVETEQGVSISGLVVFRVYQKSMSISPVALRSFHIIFSKKCIAREDKCLKFDKWFYFIMIVLNHRKLHYLLVTVS